MKGERVGGIVQGSGRGGAMLRTGASDVGSRSEGARATDIFGLLRLLFASLVTGLAVGVVGSAFRGLLSFANKARDALIAEAHASRWQGFVAVALTVAIAAMIARWLVVRFAPMAAGSGVQHVEAVMRNEAFPA